MSAELNSDVTMLSAAMYRVKKLIGPDRYAAAQTALQARKGTRSQQATSVGESSEADLALRSAPALGSDDVSETLALLRAAGIGRYGQ